MPLKCLVKIKGVGNIIKYSGITNQPGMNGIRKVDNFLKLQGNLKGEGQSKFTNDLFIYTNQYQGLSEPDITGLIDSNKGDLR